MFASFITKQKNDGSIVIDRDRSFMALVEELEPYYEEIFGNGIDDEMRAIFSNTKNSAELIANYDEEDDSTDGLALGGAIFNIVDSEDRNIKAAIPFLELAEKIRDTDISVLLNFVLGFIYYCAPLGLQQNKELALSYLKKAEDIDREVAEKFGVIEAIETITSAENNNSTLVVSNAIERKVPAILPTASNESMTSAAEEKKQGIWTTVFNTAVSALSKISAEKINDPVFMRKALGKAYELLPFWVRAVVSEELFFNFCFDRRLLIVERLAAGKTNLSGNAGEYLLPQDDEKPIISKDTILVNIVEKHSGNLFSEDQFYFFPTAGLNKFNNAYESYIKEALDKYGIAQNKDGFFSRTLKAVGAFKNELPEDFGIPLFMYDSTAFGSCKTGFMVTSKAFVIKEKMAKPLLIKLNQINSFEIKKSFLSAGKIYINDQLVIDCNQGKKESLHKFSTMFNEIIEATC